MTNVFVMNESTFDRLIVDLLNVVAEHTNEVWVQRKKRKIEYVQVHRRLEDVLRLRLRLIEHRRDFSPGLQSEWMYSKRN